MAILLYLDRLSHKTSLEKVEENNTCPKLYAFMERIHNVIRDYNEDNE